MITFENFVKQSEEEPLPHDKEENLTDAFLNAFHYYIVKEPFNYTWCISHTSYDPEDLGGVTLASRNIICDSIEELRDKPSGIRGSLFATYMYLPRRYGMHGTDSVKLTFPHASIRNFFMADVSNIEEMKDEPFFIETYSKFDITSDSDDMINITDTLTGKTSSLDLSFHFDLYNFYTSLKDENKIVKIIKTIDRAMPILKAASVNHWSRSQDISLSELKVKYGIEGVTIADWARSI
jgi:hypothetical protein